MATGTMSREDLSMRDFWTSVGLGAAFGAIGGKYYSPEAYWGRPRWPKTAEEMDELLGFKGVRVSDPSATPGRNQVKWVMRTGPNKLTVVGEQHPYIEGAYRD